VIRVSAQLRNTIQRTTLPLLVLVSASTVLLGKADEMMLDSVRTTVTDGFAPALDIASRPLVAAGNLIDRVRGAINLYQDNRRLEQDNERLMQWQQSALKLAADNKQLRGLLKAVPEPNVAYVTARVIANSGGAYVRTVMVNAGSEDNLSRGQAAIGGDGLVGRLTEVGARAARVLLITDLNSRVPVTVENSHRNAVLAGDNSERPRLAYVGSPENLKIGDRVVTSGEGGVFPPGLPVGVIASLDGGGARVEPYVELSQLSYLLIVNYGLAGGLPQPVPIAPHSGRRPKAAPPPDETSVR